MTPSAVDESLREAMLAHRAGRLAAAEIGYRRVLKQRPDDPKALHFLALLLFHQGDVKGGVDHLTRSLRHEPANARGWNALGGMYRALADAPEARHAYRRATAVAPHGAEGWYNLAICERDDGEIDAAVTHLQTALAREPDYFRAYEALAMLLYQLGRTDDAAAIYSEWIRREPSSATARHMAAAASGANAPSRASDQYVRELFDQAASEFDTRLGQLEYRAHQLVSSALIERADKSGVVLDAGCGTGLCGPLLRPHCQRLIGVDLSAKMLDHARARQCYDELHAGELTEFMRRGSFDAIVSADTLVYFGALEEPFAAAFASLRAGGWLVFTLEAGELEDHKLEFHGRYAHGERYIRGALSAAGFEIDSLTKETLRQERNEDVRGYRVVARKR